MAIREVTIDCVELSDVCVFGRLRASLVAIFVSPTEVILQLSKSTAHVSLMFVVFGGQLSPEHQEGQQQGVCGRNSTASEPVENGWDFG